MLECLKKEVNYRTSRASGPGGQHVNKTESRVELLWHLSLSECLNATQKIRVQNRLQSRMTEEGWLILRCDKHRSQHRNREEVTTRFIRLVQASLVQPKKRKATSPTRGSIEKRISAKKIRGQTKRSRMKPPDE
jgi:ribosome-associated protein